MSTYNRSQKKAESQSFLTLIHLQELPLLPPTSSVWKFIWTLHIPTIMFLSQDSGFMNRLMEWLGRRSTPRLVVHALVRIRVPRVTFLDKFKLQLAPKVTNQVCWLDSRFESEQLIRSVLIGCFYIQFSAEGCSFKICISNLDWLFWNSLLPCQHLTQQMITPNFPLNLISRGITH